MGKHKKQIVIVKKAVKKLSMQDYLDKLIALEQKYIGLSCIFEETHTQGFFVPSLSNTHVNANLVRLADSTCTEICNLIETVPPTQALLNRSMLLKAKIVAFIAKMGLEFQNLEQEDIINGFEKAVIAISTIEFESDEAFQEIIFDSLYRLRLIYSKWEIKKRFTIQKLDDFAFEFGKKCGLNHVKINEMLCGYLNEAHPLIYYLSPEEKKDFSDLIKKTLAINAGYREKTKDSAESIYKYAFLLLNYCRFYDQTNPRSVWLLLRNGNTNAIKKIDLSSLLKYFNVSKKYKAEFITPAIVALTKIKLIDLRKKATLFEDVDRVVNAWIVFLDILVTAFQNFHERNDIPQNVLDEVSLEILYLQEQILLLCELRKKMFALVPHHQFIENRGDLSPEITLASIKKEKAQIKTRKNVLHQELNGQALKNARFLVAWDNREKEYVQRAKDKAAHRNAAEIPEGKKITKDTPESSNEACETDSFAPLTAVAGHALKIAELLSDRHLNQALSESEELFKLAQHSKNLLSQAEALDGKIFIYGSILLPKLTNFNKYILNKRIKDIRIKECKLLKQSYEDFRSHCADFSTLYTQYKKLVSSIPNHQRMPHQQGIAFALACLEQLHSQLEDLLKQAKLSISTLRDKCKQERKEFLLNLGYEYYENAGLVAPNSEEDISEKGREVFASFEKKDKPQRPDEINYTERLETLKSLTMDINLLVETYVKLPQQTHASISEIDETNNYINAMLDALRCIRLMAQLNKRPIRLDQAVNEFAALPTKLTNQDRELIYDIVREHFASVDRTIYTTLLDHYGLLTKFFGIKNTSKEDRASNVWMIENKLNRFNPPSHPLMRKTKPHLVDYFFKAKEKTKSERMLESLHLDRKKCVDRRHR